MNGYALKIAFIYLNLSKVAEVHFVKANPYLGQG